MSILQRPYWRLSGYYFCYFAFLGVFSPYFGLYLASLGFSAWDIGLLLSQMQLMRLLGPYVWGWLADRGHARVRIVRLAAIISLAGFLAFFWVERFETMLVAMAILAFFWSAALPLVETLTFDHLRGRPGSYGSIRLWGSLGFIVAVLGTGALLDRVPPLGVLWVCTLVLVGILGFSLCLPEAGARPDALRAAPVGGILAQARVRALFGACFAMSLAHGAYYIFYSIHLAAHGYQKAEVGLLWALGVLAEILVFMAMPRLTRRLGLRRILLVSFAAAVVRFLLIGWGVGALWALLVAQLLHALTFGAFHAAAVAVVHHCFPGATQARGQALYSSLSFGAGGLLGGLLSGYLWESAGAGWTYSLSALAALAGGWLVWRWVRGAELERDMTPA
ncbi:MAG: MFS transporter [Azovibrio sp.]|nr:MFS transporter [Azovibrio sp.]